MIENAPERMKVLLAKFGSGQMKMDELDKECAYWYAETFPDLRITQEPGKPQRFRDYETSDYATKKSMHQNFWLLPEINEYIEGKQHALNTNRSVFENLKDFKECIPEGDFITKEKYEVKIQEFAHALFA